VTVYKADLNTNVKSQLGICTENTMFMFFSGIISERNNDGIVSRLRCSCAVEYVFNVHMAVNSCSNQCTTLDISVHHKVMVGLSRNTEE